jgi:tRNA-uridine 2-sulfurtransferase
VVQGHDHPLLQAVTLQAQDVSWTLGEAPSEAEAYGAKTRYRQADAACALQPSAGGFSLSFTKPQWAVTPGQSAVLYQGEVCLGGGVIQ